MKTLLKFLKKVSVFSWSFFVYFGSSSSSSTTRSGMPLLVLSFDCEYFQKAFGFD